MRPRRTLNVQSKFYIKIEKVHQIHIVGFMNLLLPLAFSRLSPYYVYLCVKKETEGENE